MAINQLKVSPSDKLHQGRDDNAKVTGPNTVLNGGLSFITFSSGNNLCFRMRISHHRKYLPVSFDRLMIAPQGCKPYRGTANRAIRASCSFRIFFAAISYDRFCQFLRKDDHHL